MNAAIKERPILFSAPMVRAIQQDRKTQTRREVKPVGNDGGFVLCDGGKGWWPYRSDDGESSLHTVKRNGQLYQDETPHGCPYGRAGDRLWVRETLEISEGAILYAADGEHCADASDNDASAAVWNRYARDDDGGSLVHGKVPSIFMPRWASRILLEVVSVRVERLQDISEADALAEGVDDTYSESAQAMGWCVGPRTAFRFLWQSINGADSWEANPWVWVVEFRRIDAAAIAKGMSAEGA